MTDESMRLFIAVPLPDGIRSILAGMCGRIKEAAAFQKWVHPLDTHITVQFLGDTSPKAVPAITERLKETAAGVKPFELALQGLGVFGRPESPRILWAGIQGSREALDGLHRSVTAAMQPAGFTPEEREYRPHITLARTYKGPGPFPVSLLEANSPNPEDGLWTADRLILYRTHMKREPMYEAIGSCPFGPSSP